jgi:hypothetical protein
MEGLGNILLRENPTAAFVLHYTENFLLIHGTGTDLGAVL